MDTNIFALVHFRRMSNRTCKGVGAAMVRFDYQREDVQKSSRTVHPLGLFYWGKVWLLVAWCELHVSFRRFRLDRMSEIARLNDKHESIPDRTLQDLLDQCD